jgi:thermostable 8-oxoguanine DNA glycosylase
MAKNVTIKIDVRAAAAVRQILFDAQKGYTYDEESVPLRIVDIRSVIADLDKKIEEQLEE